MSAGPRQVFPPLRAGGSAGYQTLRHALYFSFCRNKITFLTSSRDARPSGSFWGLFGFASGDGGPSIWFMEEPFFRGRHPEGLFSALLGNSTGHPLSITYVLARTLTLLSFLQMHLYVSKTDVLPSALSSFCWRMGWFEHTISVNK